MNYCFILLLLLLVSISPIQAAQSSDNFNLPTSLFTTAGGAATSLNYRADFGISLSTEVAEMKGDNYSNKFGLWYQSKDTIPPVLHVFPVDGDVYTEPVTVTVSSNEPATIYCTINGDDPTTASPVYVEPLHLSQTTTLKCFAVDTASNSSIFITHTYTIIPTNVTLSVTISDTGSGTVTSNPDGINCTSGTCTTEFASGTSVTLAVTPATGYTASVSSTCGGTLVDTTYTTNAIVADCTVVATFSDVTAPVTTASPASGVYASTQTVTLSCSDTSGTACAAIYYTTDGTEPTTASAVYGDPLTINPTTTLKFFAQDLAGNSE
ncbi:MAG: chitobiase/beta-hexosaminidase C-terminal domain-containing protein, partial [Deltaproteobacteria bacterium]|nr:chitobiase/beta-hexosaminidase C-terminal domain-containing protein [Deltaproteobacteria bacterium]